MASQVNIIKYLKKSSRLFFLDKVYNYALSEGDPPQSWTEAIISVIHKVGKDPTLCSSYRPISLLCVDLKILTEYKNILENL